MKDSDESSQDEVSQMMEEGEDGAEEDEGWMMSPRP
jgi:hypothetical protein